jgi:hypothetical protein
LDRKLPIIHVECYAGSKNDERPVSFVLDSKKLMVEKVMDQWRTPDFDYFRILAHDGKGYLLRNDPRKGEWVLEKVER